MMSDIELKAQTENLQNNLNNLINSEKEKLEILLDCLKNLNDIIQEEDNFDNPTDLLDLLSNIKSNLDTSRANISTFEKAIKNIDNSLSKSNTENILPKPNLGDFEITETKINPFPIKEIETESPIETTEAEIPQSSNKALDVSEGNQVTKLFEQNSSSPENNGLNSTLKAEISDNNTLLISEIQNKVLLPFSVSELEKELAENGHYSNLQDIIDTKYTIPLDKYKNAALARFKEAYNLMRKKEKASVTSSLDLALELTFNNLLNPAIITACKNLDELDIYLDCLSSNELDDFKIFKVKYEMLPTK